MDIFARMQTTDDLVDALIRFLEPGQVRRLHGALTREVRALDDVVEAKRLEQERLTVEARAATFQDGDGNVTGAGLVLGVGSVPGQRQIEG